MADERHNGFTNYETWNRLLWINENRDKREFWQSRAFDLYSLPMTIRNGFTRVEETAFLLAGEIESSTKACSPLDDVGAKLITEFYADILANAISRVNWYEVAKSVVEDAIGNDSVVVAGGIEA